MLKLFCILDYKVIFIHFQIVDYIFLILNDFALVNFFYCMRKILVHYHYVVRKKHRTFFYEINADV